MPPTLSSRTALVTGASRGIGRAIALALAEAGANVAVNYRERKAQAEETVKAVEALGRKAVAFQADVSNAKAVADLIQHVETALGPIDILINNAGAVGVHYNASKAGMEGLTRGYAARLAKDGVTVNAVAPSLIETEMIASHRSENIGRIPVGRLGTGEEVAAVVVMIAANAYMTGQTVQVNGGMHLN